MQNPLSILCPEVGTGCLPKPTDKNQEYERYYLVLTSVHDNMLPETESISKGVWPEEFANLIWRHYIWRKGYYSDGKFTKVALDHVQDDLVEKPAETQQKALSLRQRTWTCIKRIPRWICGLIITVILAVIAEIVVNIFTDFGLIKIIKSFVYRIFTNK